MKTLADKAQAFLASPWHKVPVPAGDRKALAGNLARMRGRLRSARRFYLDNDFVTAAVHAASRSAETTIARCDLAFLPFDHVWLEWDQEHRCRVQEALGTSDAEPTEGDRGLGGFLLWRRSDDLPEAGWSATPFMSLREEGGEAEIGMCAQALWPMALDTHEELLRDVLGGDEIWTGALFRSGWGYKPESGNVPAEEYEELMKRLAALGGTPPEMTVTYPLFERASQARREKIIAGYALHAMESRGDLRFLVTVLAMLNCVPVNYVHRPAAGRFSRRLNSISYLDNHVVKLRCASARVVPILDSEVRLRAESHRRAHEVRGHWALAEYRKGGRACRHLPALREGNHAICGECGRMIVWRDHHVRGDASIGFVRKAYEVTA